MENPTVVINQYMLDIELIQGDTQEIVIEFKDDAGNPIELSDTNLKMQIKSQPSISAPVISHKEIGNGISVDGNVATITFGEETLDWTGEEYYYDILVVKENKRRIRGRIFLIKSITR